MTKPITAAATMILAEECKLRLNHAVDKWLPELANRRVLKHIDAPLNATEPAKRPIMVHDLPARSSSRQGQTDWSRPSTTT